ncbi:Teichoic acids export ATP-binding protein TagH [Kordia antarctica]|uniref:Teichoic acids export ATP-binding protein TagH n=1 Tax=Kordia antarctica TaxID=1218801 RepID=A0A7L4ZEU2_9FLAO|nr:ABC transporter ATP-binding protein [Kordia antarctica]QHI35242.1 Teichoic acids export ATP-binding protein TagH [Kordia antarctica]
MEEKDIILQIENLSKQYRLGVIGTGTISHDLNRWWHKIRGKEDPYLKIGEKNARTTVGDSNYVWALKDVSFNVEKGEVLGIIGKNGAGKSTLLKLLSKVTMPTTGIIRSKGRIASLLEVGTGFHPELTGKENIFLNGAILGMTKAEIASKFDEIVAFAGVQRYVNTPVKRYSSGMKVRLAFAVAAHLEPEILVVDEVLAVGDAEFQKKAIGKMQDIAKGEGRTVLFVSHDMTNIQNLCTKSILLENGGMVMHGDTEDVIKHYLQDSEETYVKSLKDHRNRKKGTQEFMQKITIGDGSSKVISGKDVTIRVDLDLNSLEEFSIGYLFKNEKGQVLMASNTMQYGKKLLPEKGKNSIDIIIKDLPLAPASYSVSLFLGNGKFDIDIIEDAITFPVFWEHEHILPPPKKWGSTFGITLWEY